MDEHLETARKRMMALLTELAPLQRMINSPGLDRTFEVLTREVPQVAVHEYPTGMECEGWIVPPSWEVAEGFIEDEAGATVASIEQHPLFVAPYSEPVDGWFTKSEIAKRLRTDPEHPDAFLLEHRNAYDYRRVDWGITLPYGVWSRMADDARYRVCIKVSRNAGSMKVAEWFLPGERRETICLNAHIDELCNDDLSGCVVAIEVMRALAARRHRQYSYLMVLSPELIGTIFYVHAHRERLKEAIGLLNLEAVGAGRGWLLKRALRDGSALEAALREAFAQTKQTYTEADFFGGYGNDERVVAWPTIGIPGVAVQRHPFKEYHTSGDTLEIIDPFHLSTALDICLHFIDVIEGNFIPEFTGLLPPWLTRHGLYFDATDDRANFHRFNNLVLFNLDGTKSVIELAEQAGMSFETVRGYLERFAEKGLIRCKPAPWPGNKLNAEGR